MRIWLLIGFVIWCGCRKTSDPLLDPPAQVAMPASAEAGALAKANNQFAVELWRKAAATPGNLAISPVSITTALAMAWRGAKGDTAAQMRAVLHFDADAGEIATRWGQLSRALQDPGRPMTLRIANRLFGEASYPFERAFGADTRSAFGAAFEPVAFASGADAVR
ncbi:MAG TPA: serpin family protein, partial [Kofleriaceae bacterium]